MRRAETALLVALAATWGAVYPLTTVVLRDITPEGVVFWRTATAACVLVPVALGSGALSVLRTRWRALLVAAVLQATLPLLLLTAGQEHVSASVAGIISGAQPIIVATFAVVIRGAHRPGAGDLLGIAVGISGVALLFGGGLEPGHTELLGGLEVLGSAVFFALGAVWIDARLAGVQPVVTAACAMGVSAVALLPFAAVSAGSYRSVSVDAELIALGTAGTGASLVLFYSLIQRVGATRAGLGFLLAPAFAVIYGATLLGDKLSPGIVGGLGLITAGSLLALRSRQRGLARTDLPAPRDPAGNSGPAS
jgi:drug/metabolite transporter (DMT)-like permease